MAASTPGGRWSRKLLLLLLVIAPALLLRGCVVATFAVRSASMEPTLRAGEHLLVLRPGPDQRPLRRWDVVLLDRGVDAEVPDDYDAVVKRVAGLPGEFLQIRNGHVFVGPERDRLVLAPKPDDLVASLLVPLHQSQALSPPWSWTGALPLVQEAGGVRLRSDGAPSLALYGAELRDGRSGEQGTEPVTDSALELVVAEADGVLLLGLREGVDLFRARLGPAGRGGASLHHNRAAQALASAPDFPGLQPGARVRFWNVDDRLRLFVDDRLVLACDLPPGVEPESGAAQLNAPEVGVEDGQVLLRQVTVLRCVHYGAQGSYGQPDGTIPICKVPADGVFVLGDWSARSRDSRHMGPVLLEHLLGRPLAVYRPWGLARWLGTDGVRR